MKKGKIIEINGLDCSFKETNAKKLEEYIKNNITEKVKLISFPQYDENSSYFIKRYLSGTYKNIKDKKVISLFYSLDRMDNAIDIKKYIEEGYYIIFDRYTGSNALYQTINMKTEEEKKEYLNWLYDIENNILQIPKVDIQITLINHPDIIYSILENRKNKSVDGDIIENDKSIMYKIFDNTKFICNELKSEIVYCFNENNGKYIIKDKDEIFTNIIKILNKKEIL